MSSALLLTFFSNEQGRFSSSRSAHRLEQLSVVIRTETYRQRIERPSNRTGMSSGYKHLYSCVTFILFMVVANFYKNKIHQAREREAFVRTKTRGNIPVKHSLQLMKHRPVAMFEDEEDASWISGRGVGRASDGNEMTYRESVLERMKEFSDECKDMEVFSFIKEREDGKQTGAKGYEPPVAGGPQQKTTNNSTRQQDTSQNSSVYVFLSVLIILLIAAGVDIAKHIRANPRQDNIRRLSLQNYQALIREKQKQFRMMKQHYSQPSMSISRSIDESNFPLAAPPCLTANFTSRTREDLEGYDSKAPPPLLRRQSVPALMRPSSSLLSKNGSAYSRQMCRRPSVDSYGGFGGGGEREVADLNKAPNGSPTEMRRRVRMLHRH